jgi:CHAT domain-containing protein
MVGVLHTVSGMWQLEDRVSLEVVKEFFRELKDGEGWLMGERGGGSAC